MIRLLLLLLLPTMVQLDGQTVRFHATASPPAATRHGTQLEAADWARHLAGRRARLHHRGSYLEAELEDGSTVRFEHTNLDADLLTPRQTRERYWWNDLLLEYPTTLLALHDESPVEMTFTLNTAPERLARALPPVLARAGMFVPESSSHDGLLQFQTDFVQEDYPGLFNPPVRRYRYLITITPREPGSHLRIRATVTSWQKYPGSDFYGWRPDESPSIRQRIRQTVAELLTSLAYPNDWWVRLQDYQAGFTLAP